MPKLLPPTYDEYFEMFAKYGDPGKEYIFNAYPRFCITKKFIDETVNALTGKKILDIGAHWLHHAALYAMDGFTVTGADICYEYDNPVIKGISKELNINLLPYKDLSNPKELDVLPENSFNLILFTEIIEHITFNPVSMWNTLYRLLAPGGRIVVTTPNYFNHSNGRILKDLLSIVKMQSTGLCIREIVEVNTYGHHWKIYSARDLIKYFKILSPDFTIKRVEYFDCGRANPGIMKSIKRKIQKMIPILRDTLYMEIELKKKNSGITAKTHW